MNRRQVLTFLTGTTAGIAVTIASIPFIRSLLPSSHKRPPEYDRVIEFPKLQPGQMIAVSTVRGPIYVLRRSPEQIAALLEENVDLRDPSSIESSQPVEALNNLRSIKP